MKYIIDTHCHMYPAFSPELWASSACKNFSFAKKNLASADVAYGVILTERIFENYFKMWQEHSPFTEESQFRLSPYGSTMLRIEEKSTGLFFSIYPGRQFRTAENLEVLSVSGRVEAPDGLSAEETISEIIRQNHIPVLPWSFGKWLGKRRKKVMSILEHSSDALYIGDILHRPKLEPLETIATRFNKKILAGTDPLPITGDAKKVARKTTLIANVKSPNDEYSISEILTAATIATIDTRPLSFASIMAEQVGFMIQKKLQKKN